MPRENRRKRTNVTKPDPLPPSYSTLAVDGSLKRAVHISPTQDVNETPVFYHIGNLKHVPTPFPTPLPTPLCFGPLLCPCASPQHPPTRNCEQEMTKAHTQVVYMRTDDACRPIACYLVCGSKFVRFDAMQVFRNKEEVGFLLDGKDVFSGETAVPKGSNEEGANFIDKMDFGDMGNASFQIQLLGRMYAAEIYGHVQPIEEICGCDGASNDPADFAPFTAPPALNVAEARMTSEELHKYRKDREDDRDAATSRVTEWLQDDAIANDFLQALREMKITLTFGDDKSMLLSGVPNPSG